MTTSDPGASEVFTHGAGLRPLAAALRATRPAPIITAGLEVLVHEVMAAITTEPSWIWCWQSSTQMVEEGLAASRSACGWSPPSFSKRPTWRSRSASRRDTSGPTLSLKFCFMSPSSTRSCGRRGPASEGCTVPMSSSSTDEYCGSGAPGSCHMPCAFA